MAKAVRFHETGGPEVLRYQDVEVGTPGPGEVKLRHVAVGLNYADTYFRNGTYRVPLPAGIGVEASGIVQAIGSGVGNVAVGDRVTYTGFVNTLGAYSTERLVPAAPLIKLPAAIPCETAAAMTMRGLTAAYLLRRVYPFQAGETILLHAAAGGVGLIVSQWAKLLGLNVIGTVSSAQKAEVALLHGCTHTIDYSHEDVAKRVREITEQYKDVNAAAQIRSAAATVLSHVIATANHDTSFRSAADSAARTLIALIDAEHGDTAKPMLRAHVIQRAVQPDVFDKPLGADPYIQLGDAASRGARLLCAGRHTREKCQDRVIRIFARHVATLQEIIAASARLP